MAGTDSTAPVRPARGDVVAQQVPFDLFGDEELPAPSDDDQEESGADDHVGENASSSRRWHDVLGVFDLETTGVDVTTARIVTAHVGVIDGAGVVVERKDWLVDPGVEIPEGAAAVHGITTERARALGRPSPEVLPEILAALASVFARGLPLVVYNAPYDLSLLRHEAVRQGLDPLVLDGCVVDPLVIDKALDRFRKGKRTLTAAAEFYDVALTEAHSAGADAIAAGHVAQAIARRFDVDLDCSARDLHDRQITWCGEQAASFQDYMRRTQPSFTANGDWPIRG